MMRVKLRSQPKLTSRLADSKQFHRVKQTKVVSAHSDVNTNFQIGKVTRKGMVRKDNNFKINEIQYKFETDTSSEEMVTSVPYEDHCYLVLKRDSDHDRNHYGENLHNKRCQNGVLTLEAIKLVYVQCLNTYLKTD